MADNHGPLFDEFPDQHRAPHGGQLYDEGFGMQSRVNTHGRLYDLFGVPKNASQAHGERYDEFGWHSMPAIHGQQFDSDFRTERPDDNHGTWFDIFRGGTQVRYMLNGVDFEGTVIDVEREYARVQSGDHVHEVGLSQFLGYRSPTQETATPGLPEATREDLPSAHNATAHGSFGERESVSTGSVTDHVSEGPGNTDARSGIPAGIMDTVDHVKTRLDGALDVLKDVTSAETAAQGKPSGKTVSHRSNCPRGGSAPCGADVDGHCSLCNASVRDHEAVGKAFGATGETGGRGAGGYTSADHHSGGQSGDPGISVPERDHKQSDHNMPAHGSDRGRCPHCGQILEHEAQLADQGAPSRKEKQGSSSEFPTVSHKCVGTSLDVLKELAA